MRKRFFRYIFVIYTTSVSLRLENHLMRAEKHFSIIVVVFPNLGVSISSFASRYLGFEQFQFEFSHRSFVLAMEWGRQEPYNFNYIVFCFLFFQKAVVKVHNSPALLLRSDSLKPTTSWQMFYSQGKKWRLEDLIIPGTERVFPLRFFFVLAADFDNLRRFSSSVQPTGIAKNKSLPGKMRLTGAAPQNTRWWISRGK